jgi:uncharacterized protein (TIGR00369 family)
VSQREQLFARATNGLAELLGIEVTEITDERVVATMPVDARTRQPFGVLHGGASLVLAETVASVGACSRIDLDKFDAYGQEINANHVRAKTSGIVTAVALPAHIGRSSHVWTIEIRDDDARLVCIARCTMAIVAKRQ